MGINDKSILEILDKLNSGQIMLEQAAKTMRKKLKRISGVDDVLKMVVDKKISTEEGLTLLNALTEGEKKESTTHGAIRKRSKGVAVFGFLIILFSIIATLMSCVPVIHSLCVSSEPRVFRFPPLFISCILLFFITLFNISWFICGINILRLREWARRSILGLSIFQLILIVPIALSQMLIMTTAVISSSTGGFLTLSTPRVMLGIIPMLFNIIWPILVLIFFTKSEVKKQFDAFPRLSSSGQPA